jgi:hypothetical protein
MPNTLAARPRKAASPITSSSSARPATSGIDTPEELVCPADAKTDTAPRHGHQAHDGRPRGGDGFVTGRVVRAVSRTAACLGANETDEVTGTVAATWLGAGEGAGGVNTAAV